MAKRLMDEAREAFRVHHYSYRTEEQYLKWVRRYILFHGKRHPREMGADEIQAFLNDVANVGKVSASTQNQALSALLFLYKKVLKIELPYLGKIVRAKRPQREPIVLNRTEVVQVRAALKGKHWLMASLLYGSGLRLIECLRLRVQDTDLEYLQLTIRDGKGAKDRRTILPETLVPHLQRQLEVVRDLHRRDCDKSRPGVSLPYAIDRTS